MAELGRPVRSQGVAGTWPVGRAAPAGGFAPAGFGVWPAIVETAREWVRAEAGAGRLLPWVPVAFRRHRALFRCRSGAGAVGRCRDRHRAHARRRPVAAESAVRARDHDRGGRGWLCHGDLEDGAHCPYGAGQATLFGIAVGLRRDPRHPRAHGSLRAARHRHGGAAQRRQARARPPLGAQGDGTAGRQFRAAEGALDAADLSRAPGQLRFLPRHVLSRHRRLWFCNGRDYGGSPAGDRRLAAALRSLHAGLA